MKILLDTHIFLWYISGDQRIPESMLGEIRQPENEVYLSVISLWEVIIKYQLGKIPLPETPEIYLPTQRQKHMIQSLDVNEACVKRLADLPAVHRDPFDRLLICQTIEHDMFLATVDRNIQAYSVNLL